MTFPEEASALVLRSANPSPRWIRHWMGDGANENDGALGEDKEGTSPSIHWDLPA